MGLTGTRSLKFFYDDCLIDIRMVPYFIKKVDDFYKKLEALKINNSGYVSVMPDDSVIAEILKRRGNNNMIFILSESDDDVGEAIDMFRILTTEDINMRKAIRVGKHNKNGI